MTTCPNCHGDFTPQTDAERVYNARFINHLKGCTPRKQETRGQRYASDLAQRQEAGALEDAAGTSMTGYERSLIQSKGIEAALRANAGRRRFSRKKKGA